MFCHFLLHDEDGLDLETSYPALARKMYEGKIRHMIHKPSLSEPRGGKVAALDREVGEILHLAMNAPPSKGPAGRGKSSGKCVRRVDRSCR